VVDGGDHDHDSLLGEHLAVAQHAVADVADDAVHVEVAGAGTDVQRGPAPCR
jgi:hypothetical protein